MVQMFFDIFLALHFISMKLMFNNSLEGKEWKLWIRVGSQMWLKYRWAVGEKQKEKDCLRRAVFSWHFHFDNKDPYKWFDLRNDMIFILPKKKICQRDRGLKNVGKEIIKAAVVWF